MKKITFALLLIFTASATQAEQCASSKQVAEQIQTRFGEKLSHVGVLPNANVLEIYSHPRTGTWTMLVTLPDRRLSCLLATGTGRASLDLHLASLS